MATQRVNITDRNISRRARAGKYAIGFRVTDSLRARIEAEALKRRMSIQAYLTAIIENRIGSTGSDQGAEYPALWSAYVAQMPVEKVRLFAEVMKLDLQHFKSSRRNKVL